MGIRRWGGVLLGMSLSVMAFAAEDKVAVEDGTPPAAEGALTQEQIQPIETIGKVAGAAVQGAVNNNNNSSSSTTTTEQPAN